MKLRFAGWDARWDEWHKLDEDRIRLLVQPPKAAGAGKGRKAIGAVGIGKGLRGVKRKVWAGHGGSDVSKPNKPLNKAKVDPEVQKKIAAVLEKHLNIRFSDQDIYVNVAGGMRLQDVAAELGIQSDGMSVERWNCGGQFLVDVRGKAAHVGRAFTEGISAVTKLGEILVEIGKLPEPERGMVANVGPITGGNAANAVPDHATAFGNVRFPDQAVADELGAKLDALATSALGAMLARATLD